MLRQMRDRNGRPSMRARWVALTAAIGLLVVSAPAVIALVRWFAGLVW